MYTVMVILDLLLVCVDDSCVHHTLLWLVLKIRLMA